MLYLTGAALIAALVVLATAIALLQQQSRRADAEVQRQTELNVRLRQLQGLLIYLGEAETGQRGYLLTGDPEYRDAYRTAAAQMPSLLVSLEGLEPIEPGLQARADGIKEVVAQKLAELAETVRLYETGSPTQALVLVQTGIGKQAMLRARQEINAITQEVRQDRDEVAAEIARSGDDRQTLAIAAAAALAFGVLLAATQIARLLAARTRFEAALAASESRHRKIVEDQSELISLAHPDGTLTYVNPAYARQLGTTQEALVGRNLFEHVEPEHRAQVRAQLQRVLASGAPAFGENRMLTPDGRDMWVAWTNSPQTGADGRKLLHSVGRDITPQKKAEAALRDSEEFLSRTGRLAGVGGWEVDLVTRQPRWSDQVRRLHEVDDAYVPAIETGLDFYEPESRERVAAAVETAQREGTPFDLELRFVTAKGRRLCVRVVGDVQRDAQGVPVRLAGAMQDITERKDLEDRIRESERFVREITDKLPIAIAYVDAQGRYQFVNHVHVKRYGRPREEILGRTRAELSGFPLGEAQEKVAAVLQGLSQRFVVEERQGEEVRLIDGQMVPAYDEHGAIKGFYATGTDITELKRTEMRLRQLSEIEAQARAELQLQTSTLHAIIESIPAMVAVFDRHLRYRLVNREFERQRAMRREDAIGRTVVELFGQEEFDARWPWVQKVLAGETVSYERTARHAGVLRDVSVTHFPLRLEDGTVDGFITVAQDITSHRDEERRLLHLSERDALTGLLNRAGFAGYLKDHAQALPDGGLALLYIDLDRFKPVNDTHGHAIGDAVLQQFAQRIKGLVRPTDAVARLGGDEFAIVLPGVRDHGTADTVARKVVDAAHLAFRVDALQIHIGASVGIALAPQDGTEIADLMAHADERVYAAKAAGRGRTA